MKKMKMQTRFMIILCLLSLATGSKAWCDKVHDAEFHLLRLVDHFSSLQGFSVDAMVTTDVRAGGKVKHVNRRDLTIGFKRPNRLFVSSGKLQFATNGEVLRFVDLSRKKYIERRAPADFRNLHHDEGFNVVTGHTSNILVPLLFDKSSFETITENAKRTEHEVIDTQSGKVHCIRVYGESLQWEVRVPDQQSAPSRVCITHSQPSASSGPVEPTQVIIAMVFSNWANDPSLHDSNFVAVRPHGGEMIRSLSDLVKTERPDGPDPLIGNSPPLFALQSLDGESVDLHQHIGKDVVVLDFWSIRSGASRRTLPIFESTRAAFRERGVVFLAINVRETKDYVGDYLKKSGLDLSVVVLDEDGAVAKKYGISGLPQSFLINKEGKVQTVFRGFSSDLENKFARELINAIKCGVDDTAVEPHNSNVDTNEHH